MPNSVMTKYCPSCRREDGKRYDTKCPKLRLERGGWNPHHGLWRYQIELPVPLGEKRRQLRRRRFATSTEASADLKLATDLLALGTDHATRVRIADLLKQVPGDEPLPDRDTIARRIGAGLAPATELTTAEYLTQWLDGRTGLKRTTVRSYTGHINQYLIPYLGQIPLDQLRLTHLQDMLTKIAAANAALLKAQKSPDPKIRRRVAGRRPTGPATLHRIRATLRKALNDAIRGHRLLEFNPAAHLELPSGKRPRPRVWTDAAVKRWEKTGKRPSPVMVWTPQQAGQFLDWAEEHQPELAALYTLVTHRGLRRGEAVGLPDHHLDLDEHELTILQEMVTVGYEAVIDTVKSEAGERVIPVDTVSAAALRRYLTLRAQWKLAAGPEWPDTGLVFVRPDGRAWHPELVSERFDKAVIAAGLPPVRFHDLRHLAASLMNAAGANIKEIQETLGHSGEAITSDTYVSLFKEMLRANADAAAKIVPRRGHRPAA